MLAVRLVEQLADWRVLSMADKKAVQLVDLKDQPSVAQWGNLSAVLLVALKVGCLVEKMVVSMAGKKAVPKVGTRVGCWVALRVSTMAALKAALMGIPMVGMKAVRLGMH